MLKRIAMISLGAATSCVAQLRLWRRSALPPGGADVCKRQEKDTAGMDKEDQAQIEPLMASLQAQILTRSNGDLISPEEGVKLVHAFVGIRNPALREVILNFIKE